MQEQSMAQSRSNSYEMPPVTTLHSWMHNKQYIRKNICSCVSPMADSVQPLHYNLMIRLYSYTSSS